MAVKSVIEVEVDDEAFKTFKALFDKYREQAAEMPGVWADVGKEVKGASSGFGDIVAAMMAQATLQETLDKKRKAEENRRKADEARQGRFWKDLKKGTSEVASNIKTATGFLTKWVPIVGTITGLLGGGGLFGIDTLGLSVARTRRASLGTGTTYGETKAFETNFGRFVDPTAYISGVNEALHDVSKRYALYAAGLTDRDIAGKDTAQVGASLLPKLKDLADRTPGANLQQVINARGLGQFVTLQDLERLKATPRSELGALAASYEQDRKGFDLDPRTQLKWQNFTTQLSRAGTKIETTFVDGLTPLAPALGKLSDSVSKAIGTFLANPRLKEWLDGFGKGIEDLAKYMTTDEFQKDVQNFASDVGSLAKAISDALHALGKHSVQDAAFGAAAGFVMGGPGGAAVGAVVGGGIGSLRDGSTGTVVDGKFVPDPKPYSRLTDANPNRPFSWFDPGSYLSKDGGAGSFFGPRPNASNPGNIRPTNGKGYKSYASPEDGIRAIGAQLLRYEYGKKWGHLDTIAKIVATWAPKSDGNDVDSYIADVSKRTGFGANDHLELSDKGTLAKLISAITKHENRKNSYPAPVVLKILNSSGANVVASAAAVAK